MGGFFDFIRQNFWHVAPILISGVIAVGIIFDRAVALFKTYPIQNSQGFFDKLSELVLAGKLADGVALCDRYPQKPAAKVIKQALLRAHQPEGLIEHGLDIAVTDATQAIQKRTSFLATIANVATLLGLFGTIAGLIHSFEAVGHADPQQKSALLAAGIATAMNATMMGLAVAIPCMIAFSFLTNRTNRLIAEVDQSAARVMDILKQRYYAAEEAAFESESAESKVTPIRRSA
jgi:biopolymer transport protein ExbB